MVLFFPTSPPQLPLWGHKFALVINPIDFFTASVANHQEVRTATPPAKGSKEVHPYRYNPWNRWGCVWGGCGRDRVCTALSKKWYGENTVYCISRWIKQFKSLLHCLICLPCSGLAVYVRVESSVKLIWVSIDARLIWDTQKRLIHEFITSFNNYQLPTLSQAVCLVLRVQR